MKYVNPSINLFIIALLTISICSHSLTYTNSHKAKKYSHMHSHSHLHKLHGAVNHHHEKKSHLTTNDLVAINTGN